MEKLDQAYLTDLVVKARRGDSNAFAELYAATCQRQLAYILFMLPDRELALKALEDSLTQALRQLPGLQHPELYMPWLCRICFRCCADLSEGTGSGAVETPTGAYETSRVFNLPLSESQVLLMRYGQGLTVEEIAGTLNFSVRLVKRYLRSGRRHLQRAGGELSDESLPERRGRGAGRKRLPEARLDALRMAKLLESVFDACGWELNTVPLEALASYTVYRKERFSLQRGILAAALVLFLLLPSLFVLPRYEITVEEQGERGLPVYTIRVSSVIPVGRVVARLRTRELPVYEAGARLYTVEPTRNGELTVTVELANKQNLQTVETVTEVDAEGPKLRDSSIGTDTVLLIVEDIGIGVDYREIYAESASGETYRPLSADERTGEVLFAYPQEDWDVYIPDHIGNTLHLTFTLK